MTNEPVYEASIAPVAAAYARHRMERDAVDAAIKADVDGTPAAAEVRRLEALLEVAFDSLLKASLAHPRREELVKASEAAEQGEAALKEAWPALVKRGHAKTVETPDGRVQIRVTEGVDVTDAAALAEEMLRKDVFRAYVKDLKVDAKPVRALVDAGALKAGVQAKDSYAIAFTAPKGAKA